jgi:hypothetical protein
MLVLKGVCIFSTVYNNNLVGSIPTEVAMMTRVHTL